VVVLPSLVLLSVSFIVHCVSCRGDYTGRRVRFLTLVLPSVFEGGVLHDVPGDSDVGEIHRRVRIITLVLPSLNRSMFAF